MLSHIALQETGIDFFIPVRWQSNTPLLDFSMFGMTKLVSGHVKS